nr:permease [Exiguobacterium sp. CH10]
MMIGVSIATKWEYEATLDYFEVSNEERCEYPYGEFFLKKVNDTELIFYFTGVRKANGVGANQYMISRFDLDKVIVAGTCAGIDDTYGHLDVIVPHRAVQYDCTVKEVEPMIKQSFIVDIPLSHYGGDFLTGTIATADRAVVMWKDYVELNEHEITIADTEAGAISYICRKNHVECIIIKGISDFPKDERQGDPFVSNAEQIDVYVKNTPVVMAKIFDDYLMRFL